MGEERGPTTVLQEMLNQLAAGNEKARGALVAHALERLRRLAKKMLRDNPRVHRWNETDDVLQAALVRLHRSLKDVHPNNPKAFMGLAAGQIRRELIDLYRHHYGPEGDGAHHATDPVRSGADHSHIPLYEKADDAIDPAEQVALHEAVDSLSVELREVFEMVFYGGMTQQEIADVVGVSTKTIKRRWRDARLELQRLISGPDGV